MNISIIGAGYVGLSLGVLLAQLNEVILYDINEEKVNQVNQKISPIIDEEITYYLKRKILNLSATTDFNKAIREAQFVIIATPTNYDEKRNYFDTTTVEESIRNVLKLILMQ